MYTEYVIRHTAFPLEVHLYELEKELIPVLIFYKKYISLASFRKQFILYGHIFHLEFNYCLREVIDIIERNLDETQQRKLLQGLGINSEEENLVCSQKLENIQWDKVKLQLELLGRNDVVNMIIKNTLITKGNYFYLLKSL